MRRASLIFLAAVMAVLSIGCGILQKEDPAFQSDMLAKYVIVYEESNPDYFDLGCELSDRIYAMYGVSLPVLPDVAAAPTQYEILLGDTNRYDPQGKVMEYSVAVAAGKLIIRTGGTFSAEKAVEFLCQQIFNGKDIRLEDGEHYRKALLTKAYPITENTTARIMTANILADTFAEASYKTAHYRAEILAGMLIAYTPDIIGLQEADESWQKALEGYLTKLKTAHGISYETHLSTYEGKTNYTSLLYRSDKFKVDDSGVEVFDWWTDRAFSHDYHMRNISWAQFTSLEDPSKRLIVANTHWSYRTEHADGKTYLTDAGAPIAENQLRLQCKEETDAFMSALREAHPEIPTVLTGDFNTSLSFFTQSGWTPTGYKIISEEAKNQGVSASAVPASGHFDHLFAAGSYRINRYAYFKNTDHLDLVTDHPFAYADFFF